MKAEKKELLVSVLNEKITLLKSQVLKGQRDIAELEDLRTDLAGDKIERLSPELENEKRTKPGRPRQTRKLKVVKTKKNPRALIGKPAPFKSCYKNVFWNKAQGKWNGQVSNPEGGPPEKLTKSSDNIEECADFVVEKLGLESVEDVFIEI